MGQQDGEHRESELQHEEAERHAHHEARLARGPMQRPDDRDAIGQVEQVVQQRELRDAAEHAERTERLAHDRVDRGEPDPDRGRDDQTQPGPFP